MNECDLYWAKLIGEANVILSGASDAQLRVMLFDVLEEFFDSSNCWQEEIVFTVIPDTLDYKLQPLSGRILRLYGVIDQNNVPQPAIMPHIGEVRFQYPYTTTQPMTAFVVKTVTDPLECFPPYIPDWVLPAFGRGILCGIVGFMMSQPGQSYSNPPMGNFYLQKYKDKIAHARVAMMRGNTVGAQAWAYPRQFAISSQRGGVSTYNVLPSPRR